MGDKKTELSIRISTVDHATAKLKAINDRLDKVTKPTRDFGKALSDLGEKSGLNDVIGGFKDVGSAVEGVLTKLAVIGGVAGLAVHAVLGLVKEFDDLGDAADRVGLTASQLAALRYAAEKAGAPVGALDEGFKHFSENLGQVHAKTGRLYKFLGTISPALQKQVAGAKDNATAFNLMAAAMAKLSSPADRAALAQKAFGDSALAPLLGQGAKGVKELTDEYKILAPHMGAAADAGGEVADKLINLHAATDEVKASLIVGLKPALVEIITKMTEWLTAHQGDIARWAEQVGKKLPGAVHELVIWVQKAYDKVSAFVDAVGGLGNVAIGAGAILAGPLVLSVVSLGGNLLKLLSRLKAVGGALESGATSATGFGSSLTAALGPAAVAIGIASTLNDLTGGSIKGGPLGMAQRYIDSQGPGNGRTEVIGSALRSKIPGLSAPGDGEVIGSALRSNVFGQRTDISGQARTAVAGGAQMQAAIAAIAAGATKGEAKVTIDINGAPRGTRVTTDPRSTADVDLSVGHNMGFAL